MIKENENTTERSSNIQTVSNTQKKNAQETFLRHYQETRVNVGLSSTSMLKGTKERGKTSL